MSAPALPDDPRWPRAGDWPAVGGLDPAVDVDLALLGIPAWRTSLSPTGAHATPAAVREALRRYSPALMPERESGRTWPVDLGQLSFADFGDVDEPDGPEGEQRVTTAVAVATRRARLLVAVGGDNSITVATALGAWGDSALRRPG